MGDPRVFWANVFRVLDYQGRSLEYLAQRLGVSRSAVYRWRDGSRVASEANRQAASEIIGVPVAFLFLPFEAPSGAEVAPPGDEPDEEVA